jgi:uncharacterized protein (TIGR03437 family)
MFSKALFGLAMVCGSAFGQYLSTSDDGSVVLFDSSWKLEPAALRGSSVFESRDAGAHWRSIASPGENSDAVIPFVTGDGQTYMWQRANRCPGPCMIALPRSSAEFLNVRGEVRISTYQSRLSHNGQFLLTPGFYGLSEYQMQDLLSGKIYSATDGAPRLTVLSAPADDGTIIGFAAERVGSGITQPVDPRRLVAWKPGMSVPKTLLADAPQAYTAVVTPDGSRAAVWTMTELLLVDTANGAVQRIAPSTAEYAFLVSMSNDGRRLIHANGNGRLFFWHEGGQSQLLASVQDNISSATLSGDGRIAWVLTAAGALLRVDPLEDRAEAVLPPVPPTLGAMTYSNVPGSAVLFRTSGATQPPGLLTEANGVRLPEIENGEGSTMAVQLPWDFPAASNGSNVAVTVRREGSPFVLQTDIWVVGRVQPAFAVQSETAPYTYVKAAKGDFSGLVDGARPALPGETIHVYLLGLGPLDREVRTGEPGPADVPARPAAPIACYLAGPEQNPPARGLVLPFVAYAPGLTGVYQVDMTIPADWPAGEAVVTCESNTPIGAYGRLPVGQR